MRSPTVPQDHSGGVLHALDDEAKCREPPQPGQAIVENLKGAGWVVLGADRIELDTRGAHTGFSVRDPEDYNLVASELQGMGESGHRIEMTRGRKTKCSQSRHCSLQCIYYRQR